MAARGGRAGELVAKLDDAISSFREKLERAGPNALDMHTRAGWTVKELIAHIAFWNETVTPMTAFLRNQPVPEVDAWYGGVDLEIVEGAPWPEADVHNEREARWARQHSDAEVRDRWEKANATLINLASGLVDEEADDSRFKDLFDVAAHYQDHGREIDALLVANDEPGRARP